MSLLRVNGQKPEASPPVAGTVVFHAINDDENKGEEDIEIARNQANNNNRNNNKRMTLQDAHEELGRQGLSCAYVGAKLLVGVMSECRWTLHAKMDVMVFVHQVDDGVLTMERLVADRLALPGLVNDRFVGGCPPFGFNRALQVIVVYYAKTIEPAALSKICQPPSAEYCRTTFLAAQDGAGISYFLEHETPRWGRAFYPELRFRAGRLTGRPVDGPVPGPPRWIVVVNCLVLLYLPFTLLTLPTSYTWYILLSLLVFFVIAALVQWYSEYTTHKPVRNGQHVLLVQEQEFNDGDNNHNNNGLEQKFL